jgi:hypothetical protein
MDHLTDDLVRDILRPHRDGGPISRLYATGEITEDTIPALGVHCVMLEQEGRHSVADPVNAVMLYARDAGERPPVAGWTGKL